MEIELTKKLLEYWKKRDSASSGLYTSEKINSLMEKGISLPSDFSSFYMQLNGMDDEDEEGFRFYKIDEILTMGDMFSLSPCDTLAEIVVFGDYMQSSWWYGFRILAADNYEIGIIPVPQKFKVISTSLTEFLNLYLKDSTKLYDYE
jgi:hypothetical protein